MWLTPAVLYMVTKKQVLPSNCIIISHLAALVFIDIFSECYHDNIDTADLHMYIYTAVYVCIAMCELLCVH